jgi:tetratricopeptide (TPR) repeat protein
MGCYRYQDVKTVPFEGLICLLWDVPESRQNWVVDYLSKTSLIEVKGEYYLHPAVCVAAKELLIKNESEWEMSNRKAAIFWTNKIKSILRVDDGLIAFEAFHHYFDINEYELACEIIIAERRNRSKRGERLGSSLIRFGLLESVKHSISKIINHVPDGYSLSRAYIILGDVYWLMGEILKAIESHEKSKEIAIEFNLEEIECTAFFNIGLCQINIWEIELAIRSFEKCKELSIDKKCSRYTIYSYYCLSFLNSVINLNDKAIDFANKISQDMDLTTNTAWSSAYGWLFLGRAYVNLLNVEKSFELYGNALAYAEESHYPQIKANALNGLAEISRIQNNWEQAISLHYKSIEILKAIGAKCDLAEAYFQFGVTYQTMGEHDKAKEYKDEALKLFKQMEAPKQIERVNKAFEQGAMK